MREHGRVIEVMQEVTGTSQRDGRPWRSVDFVIETDGRYVRRVRLHLWGGNAIDQAGLKVGDIVDVDFEIEASLYNGQWYNDLRVYQVTRGGVALIQRT